MASDLVTEFATTATCRPEVFERTLRSFKKNLLGASMDTLYLNVDPVGYADRSREVFKVASAYFNVVVANYPKRPCFPSAVKWCLRQPRESSFFYLEDDWELLAQVRIDDISAAMGACGAVVANLRAYDWPVSDRRICLSPGLWRTCAARAIAERLTTDANPERQMRPTTAKNPAGDRHGGLLGLHYPETRGTILIRDIGREWLGGSGFAKNVEGMNWTSWRERA